MKYLFFNFWKKQSIECNTFTNLLKKLVLKKIIDPMSHSIEIYDTCIIFIFVIPYLNSKSTYWKKINFLNVIISNCIPVYI